MDVINISHAKKTSLFLEQSAAPASSLKLSPCARYITCPLPRLRRMSQSQMRSERCNSKLPY